jgi:hypothetical protein
MCILFVVVETGRRACILLFAGALLRFTAGGETDVLRDLQRLWERPGHHAPPPSALQPYHKFY